MNDRLIKMIEIALDAWEERLHPRDADGKFAPRGVIGTHLDETGEGRKATKGVIAVLDKAKENEPKITGDVVSVMGMTKGTPEGLEYRLKTLKSAVEKTPREREEKPDKYKHQSDRYIVAQLFDNVRYSLASSPENIKSDMYTFLDNMEQKGYKVVRIKNTFNNDSNPYKGLNVQMVSPTGQRMEVQFNTSKNFKIKNGELHKLYEKHRQSKSEKEKAMLSKKMFDIVPQMDLPKQARTISEEDYKKYKKL